MVPWFEQILHALTARLTQERLHHGLLLSGPAGIGKQELAHGLANSILCQHRTSQGACGQCGSCQLIKAGTHPDYHLIQSDKQIGVDAVREAIVKLGQTAQRSGNKVCVIHAAHTMTESAANAILKTLEEPTPKTYLVLLVEHLHQLLPTLLSRCEKLQLSPPATKQAIDWLTTQTKNADAITVEMLNAYAGAPFRVLEALDHEVDSFAQFQAQLDAVKSGQTSALAMAEKWLANAELSVNWLQIICKRAYSQHLDRTAHAAYSECVQAAKSLKNAGVNKTLLLTNLIHTVVKN